MKRAIVVMGVSGCGKSTLGAALAGALGWTFVEGDDLHPQANVDKMRAGIALDDADREPFLRNVAARIAAHRETGVVASCSALKRSYRDQLRRAAGELLFVHPVVEASELRRRLAGRENHFMPPALLDSQLETLEVPAEDEAAIAVDGAVAPEQQVQAVLNALRMSPSAPAGDSAEPVR